MVAGVRARYAGTSQSLGHQESPYSEQAQHRQNDVSRINGAETLTPVNEYFSTLSEARAGQLSVLASETNSELLQE